MAVSGRELPISLTTPMCDRVALHQGTFGHNRPVGSLLGSLRKSPKADRHCRRQSGSTCPQAGIQVISIGANPVERKADVQWLMANLLLDGHPPRRARVKSTELLW